MLQHLCENLKGLLLSLGNGGNSAYRAGLLARLSAGLPSTYVVKKLEVPRTYLKAARAKLKSGRDDKLLSTGHSSTLKVNRPRKSEIDPEVLAFFDSKTIQKLQSSGKATNTTILPMSRERLCREWYVEYPQLVRDYSNRTGGLVLGSSSPSVHSDRNRKLKLEKPLTRLHANVIAANWMAQQEGFSLDREQRERAVIYDIRHQKILTGRRVASKNLSPSTDDKFASRAGLVTFNTLSGCAGPSFLDQLPASETLLKSTFDPRTWEVKPRSSSWLFDCLAANNTTFTTNYNPTTCPLHDKGYAPLAFAPQPHCYCLRPAQVAMLAALVQQQVDATLARERCQLNSQLLIIDARLLELAVEIKHLRQKVKMYELHLQQFDKCRAAVKEAEENIVPGRMVMYRDFVNQHNANGGKVNSLVLVLLYRETIGGPLCKVALHNICTDAQSQACDAWYVKDVMDHHLSERSNACDGLIAKQKAAAAAAGFEGLYITVAGDHGPHFCSKNTFYNNTLFKTMYGVVLTDCFLCSYHAFNVCDAAGCVSKRLGLVELRSGTISFFFPLAFHCFP
jgi:hypothetical protein